MHSLVAAADRSQGNSITYTKSDSHGASASRRSRLMPLADVSSGNSGMGSGNQIQNNKVNGSLFRRRAIELAERTVRLSALSVSLIASGLHLP